LLFRPSASIKQNYLFCEELAFYQVPKAKLTNHLPSGAAFCKSGVQFLAYGSSLAEQDF
jgi:hypothetical protein